jgi:large subunit ribosomal protein L25
MILERVMSTHTLNATTRTERGEKTDVLRAEGNVPAIVYGSGTDPVSITLDRVAFVKTYKDAGESSLIELSIDGKDPLHVLIQDYQQDAITEKVTHVDLRSIDVNKVIEAVVDLVFVGEAPAVKALGGTMIPSRTSVTIRCLPTNLLRNIEVNLSTLETFEDSIKVSDLKVSEDVEIIDSADLSVVSISPPRKVEEPVTTEAEEGVEGAVEGEEGEEGAAEAGSEEAKTE